MATQHRSRRARAILRQRIDCAQAVEDLQLDDEAPEALVVAGEPPVPQFVSTVRPVEGWSVLDAANAIAARYSLAEQLRALDEDQQVPVAAGRSTRGAHARTAFARTPVAVEAD